MSAGFWKNRRSSNNRGEAPAEPPTTDKSARQEPRPPAEPIFLLNNQKTSSGKGSSSMNPSCKCVLALILGLWVQGRAVGADRVYYSIVVNEKLIGYAIVESDRTTRD